MIPLDYLAEICATLESTHFPARHEDVLFLSEGPRHKLSGFFGFMKKYSFFVIWCSPEIFEMVQKGDPIVTI